MLMTEEEARGKWCPHGFLLGYEGATHGAPASVGGSYNRFDDGVPACKCIASQCMAWRWAGPEIEVVDFYDMGAAPDGAGWTCTLPDTGREAFALKSRWERKNPARRGYCGLAGRPAE